MRELRQNTRGGKNEDKKKGKKPKGKNMIVKDLIRFDETKDAYYLGFYHARMPQWLAVDQRTAFKMAYHKVQLTIDGFFFPKEQFINIANTANVQITGNRIIATSAGINIGGVSP